MICVWSGSVTSTATAIASPPASVMSLAVASAPARSRSQAATRAPAEAKAKADAAPMPDAAPVTSATLPVRFGICPPESLLQNEQIIQLLFGGAQRCSLPPGTAGLPGRPPPRPPSEGRHRTAAVRTRLGGPPGRRRVGGAGLAEGVGWDGPAGRDAAR